MRKPSNNEPILVQHPESGLYVNVRPFLNLIFDNNSDELDDLRNSVDSSIKFTNVYCSLNTDISGIADMQNNHYFFMYQIKELFSKTDVLQKKGGASCS